MTIYTRHALSAAFPSMEAADFDALAEDIFRNGQRTPSVAIGTEILDGWHRYQAALKCGMEPAVEQYEGRDPVAFVQSMNLHRRNLTASQRAMAIVACSAWMPTGRPSNNHADEKGAPGASFSATKGAMAEQADVSERTIAQAKSVISAGVQEVKDAARDGEISVKRAAEIAQLPADEQVDALHAPKQEKDAPGASFSAEPEPANDAHSDVDPLEDLVRAQVDIETLTKLLKAAEADDKVAEIVKWRRAYDSAARQQSEAMDRAKQATDREAWAVRQLRRCGKAIGQDDPSKIAPAIEAFARLHRKDAA